MSANDISILYNSIGNLRRLKFLWISMNSIKELPLEIINLTRLEAFVHCQNPIENISSINK
jgi:Leucine-rich repeat (LRR) protein